MQQGFFIKFPQGLANRAETLGFEAGDWRQSILQDLLHDGKLVGECKLDPRTRREVWWFYGRRVHVVCGLDITRKDSIFVIGLFPPTQRESGVSVPRGPGVVHVPGPWEVASMRAPTTPIPWISAEEHLRRVFSVGAAPASLRPIAALPSPPVVVAISSSAASSTASTADASSKPLIAAADSPVASPSTPPAAVSAPEVDRPVPPAPRDATPDQPQSSAWIAGLHSALEARQPALRGLLAVTDIDLARSSRLESLAARSDRLAEELATVEARILELKVEARSVAEERASLPTLEELEELRDAVEVIADLGERAQLAPPIEFGELDLPHLQQLLTACAQLADATLPEWCFDGDRAAALAEVLRSRRAAERIQAIAGWVARTFGGSPPESFGQAPDPGPVTADLADRLQRAWDNYQRLSVFLDKLPEQSQVVVRSIPDAERGPVVERLAGWAEILGETALTALARAAVEMPTSDWFAHTPAPPDNLSDENRENVRDIANHPRAIKLAITLAREVGEPVRTTGRITDFSHAVTNEQGSVVAAMVASTRPQRTDDVAYLSVPIRIKLAAPGAERKVVEVSAPHLALMPAREYAPGVTLHDAAGRRSLHWTISLADARGADGEQDPSLDAILVVPAYPAALEAMMSSRSELQLTLQADGVKKTLTFTRFPRKPPPVPDLELTPPLEELVRKRPLGVQVIHEQLAPHIRRGGTSFMVAAPRRFGKTTLLRFLASQAEGTPGTLVIRIDLGRHLSPEEASREVLRRIHSNLLARYKASPVLDEDRSLLKRESFERIQSFLAQNACQVLVLFIDEAQVLVPRQAGVGWGNDLKNLIEHHLVHPPADHASVMFALFGTNDLGLKLGRNCRDFLSSAGKEIFDFEERSLARYLREISGTESTRLAREDLANWTGNLWTLKTVLQSIFRRLQGEGRAFILDRDVRDAIDEILRRGDAASDQLWSYASSELSHSDEWDPIDAFPLAVAWAREDPARSVSERLVACQRWLQAQAELQGAHGTITVDRLQQCLDELKGRGIIRDNGSFRRPLLRELLRRRADDLLGADVLNTFALERMLVDLVPWPVHATPCDGGAQAQIFINSGEDPAQAVRVCELRTPAERRRFSRTCAAIRRVRHVSSRIEGDRYLPRVRSAGFAIDDPQRGLIVYDWISGQSLDRQWPRLPVQARVIVGAQVARAVEALHSRGVAHYDIRPRNILVDSGLRTHLIDFGLARPIEDESRTRLGRDEFTAPELNLDDPQLTPAADIYALGVFLRGQDVGAAAIPPQLKELLERMTDVEPTRRPGARDIAEALEGIVDQRLFPIAVEKKHELEQHVMACGEVHEWLIEALLPYVDAGVARQCGFLTWDMHRVMETALFVNNIFSIALSQLDRPPFADLARASSRGEVSLASLRSAFPSGNNQPRAHAVWSGNVVHAVGLLRIAWAHPEKKAKILRDVGNLLKATTDAQLVQECTRSLKTVVAHLDTAMEARGTVVRFFGCIFPKE